MLIFADILLYTNQEINVYEAIEMNLNKIGFLLLKIDKFIRIESLFIELWFIQKLRDIFVHSKLV